ncbi:DUF1665 domain protein [Talaromyces stipitatus ATCC 10500]|uniref:DUF1665 domain protein n=1 Tax=Talaromyces stipitatus (strain ATCC 10500 / CBS 375.48 / QM 6759 / NRRL 1006) TaxID=441959 RepID=B8M9M3_TALSN|nr:rRNA processing protein RRP15 [Talaromyces stipitatus ATCC 10500]EED18025.1 DUF1665 domain protein [Talaromyces stipitatus ATCC 10500]
MALTSASKKRKTEYHSSSEEEDENDNDAGTFAPVNLMDSDEDEHTKEVAKPKSKKDKSSLSAAPKKKSNRKEEVAEDDDIEEDDEPDVDAFSGDSGDNEDDDDQEDSNSIADDDNEEGGVRVKTVTKRHDPTAFSTSISKILSTKLPTSARADPVLSRSKSAAQVSSELANERLEQRARSKLRAEKKEEQERGRVRDVLGTERGEAGETAEEEKRLRKIAQRGVVKLFNAVRAAQVRGEEAARAEQKKGTVGIEERKKAANEISKQSFLELINGKKGKALNIEEA